MSSMPQNCTFLFSISAVLKERYYLEWNLKMMKNSKSGRAYVISRHIKCGRGFVFTMKNTNKDEQGTKKKERRSDLMNIHQELGHPSEDLKRTTGLKRKLKNKGSM